ncbi:MAG: DNA double-strand break repair nuclease NurA [Oscillospiraceae bacterium]|nr:DNA double-strand break repair nuclease NurA [Oscillospiraceae bacterium]
MPFENEFAAYEPLRRILDNKKVEELQKQMLTRARTYSMSDIQLQQLDASAFDKSDFLPELILAIDGGYQCVPVKNGFPGAEIGYITVASVLLLMKEIRALSNKKFIDPKKFRETEKATAFDSVFPGCNVIRFGEKSPLTSLRRTLFEQLKNAFVFSDFESLLDTYESLLKYRIDEGIENAPANPLEELTDDPNKKMQIELGRYYCKDTKQPLYSTDALRIHELLNPRGTSGEMYGQLSYVIERLCLVHLLRAFEKKNWLQTLRNVAFVLDGPLAIYSVSAWIVKPIIREISRINELQKKITGKDLIILGLEKSGRFVEHFNDIDTSPAGSDDVIPNNTALLLDDLYIKKNIVFSNSPKMYGEITYFGRKFFFKTKNGYRLVPHLAFYNAEQKNIKTANVEQFPRLGDVCALLNDLVSNRYPNSINPLISAHAEAAIPLSLGRRIFDDIAREIAERGATT